MIPSFDLADTIRLGNPAGTNDDGTARTAFADLAGVATDPTAVTLQVRKPDGALLAYGYPGAGADGTLTKEATGRFYFDMALTLDGTWVWTLTGTGAVATSESGTLFVRRSVF